MTFVEASDRLTACLTHADIARALDRAVNTIRLARMDSGNPNYRKPPPEWRAGIARLARARAEELEELARELEAEL